MAYRVALLDWSKYENAPKAQYILELCISNRESSDNDLIGRMLIAGLDGWRNESLCAAERFG